MNRENKQLVYACYATNSSMSVAGNISPILFLTFRSLYGISYSLLGLLVLINFVTQFLVDMAFSLWPGKFNISRAVKITPILTAVGLMIYGLWPLFLPQWAYLGLVIGTIVFSASGGLCEVLISPVIAAIPSDNPSREMSKLHSVYAWGVVVFIIVSTLFLYVAGNENWVWIPLFFSVVPIFAAVLFYSAEIPDIVTQQDTSRSSRLLKSKELYICVLAIFLGGAAECTMAQWSSSYLEQALGIPKVWGDILGMALFSVMLGAGRSLYAKFGSNVEKILFLGAIGASVCYLTAALTNIPALGLAACAFTGFCVSMLWPGNLVAASDLLPGSGVFMYAIMAAGGDLGASVAPQLVGIVTDITIANPSAAELAYRLNITAEQLSMKTGMLVSSIFPLVAVPLYYRMWKRKKRAVVFELNHSVTENF